MFTHPFTFTILLIIDTMKDMKKMVVILTLIIAACIFWFFRNRSTVPRMNQENANSTVYTYVNNVYNFSLTLPKRFSEYMSLAQSPTITVFAARNTLTNSNMKRDTPNGFNKSQEDRMSIEHYLRMPAVNESDEQSFRSWHDATINGRQITTLETRGLGQYQFWYALENDGLESVGQYYYVVVGDSILCFGTDDVARDEFENIISSFSKK